MEAKQILQADFLDLLFDNRNKKYGAYTLRRNFSKRMWLAVTITLIIALASFLAIQPNNDQYANNELMVKEITLTSIKELPAPPPPPPPVEEEPAPVKKMKKGVSSNVKAVSQKRKTTKFTTPVVREKVTRCEVPAMDEIATVDVVTTDGIAMNDLPPLPEFGQANGTGIETSGIVMEQLPKKHDENKIFEKVEIEASVDAARWRKHLERNLVRYIENAVNAGMEAGSYTVLVRFLVEKDGSITKVTTLNNPGFGLADGAADVIRKGPKWNPGEQNGKKVRSYHTQPITFVILET